MGMDKISVPSVQDSSDKEDEKTCLVMLPYIWKFPLLFKRKLMEIINISFDVQLRLRCVFTFFKVKNYLTLKCRSSLFIVSNLVHKSVCKCDTDTIHIGENERRMELIYIRASEHTNISAE